MPIPATKRFKVVIEAYFGTRTNNFLVKSHVTRVQWDDKRGTAPYTLKQSWHARIDRQSHDPLAVPQLFSKAAAERVAEQVVRHGYVGKGENGRAIVTIEPVEVK